MKYLYEYYKIGKIINSGGRIPISTLLSLYDYKIIHDIDLACLSVYGRPHLAVIDKNYSDSPFQFIINPTTSEFLNGVRNIPISFNDSLQI